MIAIRIVAREIFNIIVFAHASCAVASKCPRNETLFGVVSNVDSEYRMTATLDAIAASQKDTIETSRPQRLDELGHTGVEEVREDPTTLRLVGDVTEAACGQISK